MREPKRGSNLEGVKVRIEKCEGLTAHAGAFSTPHRALESVRWRTEASFEVHSSGEGMAQP